MARPQRSRRICSIPAFIHFGPYPPPGDRKEAVPRPAPLVMTVDEYEVLRLVDYLGMTHSECADQMNISRTTVTEICESARKKAAEAFVCGRELLIEGGNWELCKGGLADCRLHACSHST